MSFLPKDTTLHTLWYLFHPSHQWYPWDELWLQHNGNQLTPADVRSSGCLSTESTSPSGDQDHDKEKAGQTDSLPGQPTKPEDYLNHSEVSVHKPILVHWISNTDPENPQNWPFWKKLLTAGQIYIYTFAVYMGGAIFSASEAGVQDHFGVNHIVSGLGFALYLIGYGVGPLLFSPISEIPSIGRNPPYIVSLLIFVILCVPAALTKSYAGLLVLRFLLGFFGSPCLATGGATLGDMFSLTKLPFAMMFWAFSMTTGPAVAPIIGGFSVVVKGWRWTSWEILWLAGPVCVLMLLFLPETSAATILHRRASRIRAHLNNENYHSQGELDQKQTSVRDIAFEALVRPWQLMFLDPVILYVDIYSSLCYAIFYSFFESFPHVYEEVYGFSLGEQGLAYLSVTIGTMVAAIWYMSYNYFIVERRIHAGVWPTPEDRLFLALFSTPLMPVGLFVFAWTSRSDIHWIVSCLGVAVNTCGLITMYQCVFLYLPLAYPQYAASLFAGNDFVRSALAGGAVLFARPLFSNLGVDKGVSLLGALTAGLVPGIFILYRFGDRLRARSVFASG
ncbi:hypothetical protein ASPTUDRAFT_123277 [Aspergillus tubingensis CBS 134.48]|uniref:Major facilitator superfamily (MFS) profile domain-containing protein n=1 Tax=Aspergillus tubingensis (strain CBS 134.48) TaxID=767770 RepID=A0A1L9N0L9_ASPTC|nr:hypothetical protein ASPTUDRAFT_123277 [Aspergillus tubingensis CBS 134.48]